jgi:endonuclease/exonuclease/phosphatase family metal-dependent hydrolase
VFADAIVDLDPEVLVLAEVNPDHITGEIIAELNGRGLCYRRLQLEQRAQQNLAVLAKLDVDLANPRWVPGSDAGNVHLRQALAVDVRVGAFDCVLVAVHLKAGRGREAREVRDVQVAAIAQFVEDVTAGAEKDVVIMGDFNMVAGEDASNFTGLAADGYMRCVSLELTDAFSHIASDGPGRLLDGCSVASVHTREYVDGSLRVVPLHRSLGLALLDYRATVSDHLPLVADFRILRDDD